MIAFTERINKTKLMTATLVVVSWHEQELVEAVEQINRADK